MSESTLVYHIVVTQNCRMLNNLKGLLTKASEYCAAKKLDESVLLRDRLAPDMFDFTKQVQIACDVAKFTASRLTDKKAPVHEDKEETLVQLQKRIDETISFITTCQDSDFQNYAQKIATFSWMPGKALAGSKYLTEFAIPNLHFHITTVYLILRTNGLEIGKADYLGELSYQDA